MCNKNQQDALPTYFIINLYMFGAGLLLIIRRYLSVYTAHGMCHVFMLAGCLQGQGGRKSFRPSCGANQNTHFVFSNFFTSRKSCLVWDMWKNIVERCRLRKKIWRMRIVCCIHTHSLYVILIAFPLQRWLQERSSSLCYTYMACLVLSKFGNNLGVKRLLRWDKI